MRIAIHFTRGNTKNTAEAEFKALFCSSGDSGGSGGRYSSLCQDRTGVSLARHPSVLQGGIENVCLASSQLFSVSDCCGHVAPEGS